MFRMAGSHGLIGAAWLAALGAAAGRGDCPIFVVREWGGGLTALQTAPGRVFAAYGRELLILDTSTPATLIPLGQLDLPGDANDIAIDADLAHVTLGAAGAAILDVADAAEPELVTVYGADPNSWAQGVEVSDSLAYVAGLPPLRIFDVSNPAAPVQLNAGDEFAESYSFWDIALAGDVAVVSDCYVGCDVATVSIANPAAPFMLDTMSQPHTYVARVGVAGAYAFGADWGWGLRVFDMTDPADLRDIDGRGWSCRDVSSDGAYLYASADQGLQVYGLPNPPATLILLGEYAAGAESRQLALDGTQAFLTTESGSIEVIDVSNPSAPARVGQFPALRYRGLAVNGRFAHLAVASGGLAVVDIGRPAQPKLMGSLNVDSPCFAAARRDNLTLLAAGLAGVKVIDAFDPVHPQVIGECLPPGEQRDIAVAGDYAYVAGGVPSSSVIDISNPASPTVVGTTPTNGANGVAVRPPYCYIADGNLGLLVIDVSDPSAPVRVARLITGGLPRDVALRDDYAYVLTRDLGLKVVDISTPTSPVLAGEVRPSGALRTLALHGDRAYVGTESGTLKVFDISYPTSPRQIAMLSLSGDIGAIAADGPHLLLANIETGLSVLRWSEPADLDGDGFVGLADLSALLEHFGTNAGAAHRDGDLDGDGDVDLADLAALLVNFGLGC